MSKNQLATIPFLLFSIFFISFSFPVSPEAVNTVVPDSSVAAVETPEAPAPPSLSSALYDELNLEAAGLSETALEHAVKGYETLLNKGQVANSRYLTIVDFSQSSRKKRFYLIDMENHKLMVNTFVSHGKNSGVDMAERFSNTPNSEQSSLGFYVTGPTYTGKHGLSLRLKGQEKGFNDNAMARGVVMHGAAYVNAGRVNSAYMGRSQGCPALPEADYERVIKLIKNGSVLFVYHPNERYMQQSPVLNS